MAQSTWIALSLVALFLVYITARGELGQYLATVIGPYPAVESGATAGSGGAAGGAGDVLGQAGQALGLAQDAVSLGNRLGYGGLGPGEGDFGG